MNKSGKKTHKDGKSSGSKKIAAERETRVLLEKMHTDIIRIAETQSSTASQVIEIRVAVADLPKVKSEVKIISMAVMEISSDIKALDTRLKVVENKVDENLNNNEKRIAKLEEKVFV